MVTCSICRFIQKEVQNFNFRSIIKLYNTHKKAHCLLLFILSNFLNPVFKINTKSHFHKVGKIFFPYYKKSELVMCFSWTFRKAAMTVLWFGLKWEAFNQGFKIKELHIQDSLFTKHLNVRKAWTKRSHPKNNPLSIITHLFSSSRTFFNTK